MAEESTAEKTESTESTTDETTASAVDEDIVLDLEEAEDYEQRIDELQETVEEQREQIEELEDLMLDLSTRVADDKGMGVCPECHGPVEKVRRWFRPTRIECRRCEEVYHEY